MQVEIRADKKSMAVRGYVNVVGRDSRVLHDKQGPYIEQIMPGAFAKALASGNPVELRFDHQKTLGSTENQEELELREDNIGLLAKANVTDEAVIAAADRQELRGWSFGFVKQKDHWKVDEAGTRRRFVDELELRRFLSSIRPSVHCNQHRDAGGRRRLVEFRVEEPLEEGVDYIRQTERTVETKESTLTPSDEITMFCASKTIEIFKMKRRK